MSPSVSPAKGEVSSSEASSLVDFSRKSGADLALLEAKASKPKRRRKPRDANDAGGSRGAGGAYDEVDEDEGEDDPTSAEVTIMDEFGRDRLVPRGGELHKAYLEAKKAEAERRVKAKAEAEAYDERYSYRGNKGAGPHPAEDSEADRVAWAWSSGRGRGADAGDFETMEGQDRRAEKKIAEMLREEGGGRNDKEEKGSKVGTVPVPLAVLFGLALPVRRVSRVGCQVRFGFAGQTFSSDLNCVASSPPGHPALLARVVGSAKSTGVQPVTSSVLLGSASCLIQVNGMREKEPPRDTSSDRETYAKIESTLDSGWLRPARESNM